MNNNLCMQLKILFSKYLSIVVLIIMWIVIFIILIPFWSYLSLCKNLLSPDLSYWGSINVGILTIVIITTTIIHFEINKKNSQKKEFENNVRDSFDSQLKRIFDIRLDIQNYHNINYKKEIDMAISQFHSDGKGTKAIEIAHNKVKLYESDFEKIYISITTSDMKDSVKYFNKFNSTKNEYYYLNIIYLLNIIVDINNLDEIDTLVKKNLRNDYSKIFSSIFSYYEIYCIYLFMKLHYRLNTRDNMPYKFPILDNLKIIIELFEEIYENHSLFNSNKENYLKQVQQFDEIGIKDSLYYQTSNK